MRSRAGFCPQCGTPVNADEAAAITPAAERTDALPGQSEEVKAATTAASGGGLTTTEIEGSAASTQPSSDSMPVLIEERDEEAADVGADSRAESAAAGDTSQTTRRHRVKVAALDAMEGKIGPRVEKLRQASTVMLDEAADDPGLRFILVAAVLILISVGLLLLSQILD